MDYEKLYKAAYIAFLKAFLATGNDYKKLSWFAKNKPQQKNQQKKKAA
jgi:hypothetical protein